MQYNPIIKTVLRQLMFAKIRLVFYKLQFNRLFNIFRHEICLSAPLTDTNIHVQAFEVLTPPVGRNVEETLRQIKAFQLVRESGGTKATPSGWKPGKPVLNPGPDLVGNVWKVWTIDQAFDD